MKGFKFNSCLYEATVMHKRLGPKEHYFTYGIFMFYLDLDELDLLNKKLRLMSRNKFNLFNFRDRDHLQLPRENPDQSKNIRQHLTDYLTANGVTIGTGRIMVLTNLCTMGYQFNPVSFYYCYDEAGNPVCSVVEVCNTFREMKPYFLDMKTYSNDRFELNTAKEFYVSPFMELDTHFHFKLNIPEKNLRISINDYNPNGELIFISSLTGKRKELNDSNMLLFFISFPLITLKIITMIHWQAFLLWTRKIKFIKKSDNLRLQKEVFRPYES
ncbi:MAG: DUF1365 domain-containing protein [Dyadobacter sp.]|uniref:DUF1365 domain-containing protein n=1 Tax=Dyadobacter sp. TaxID=1914288 RepID=UPI0032678677